MEPSHTKRYSYAEIDTIAIKLLKKTFDDAILPPIDIDIIAEQLEGFHEIRLLPGMQKKFSVDACTYYRNDGLCDILIDSDVDSFNRARASFSITHELGHLVLHAGLFKDLKTIEDVVELNKRIEGRYNIIEREANYFAGAILIPHTTIFSDTERIYQAIMKGLAPDIHEPTFDSVHPKIVATLAARYSVSTPAMSIRLEQLKIDKSIRKSLGDSLNFIMWES